jgi:hypothetical protein
MSSDEARANRRRMTISSKPEFLNWCRSAVYFFAREGPVAVGTRAWAASIRPYDPELADLYVRSAEVNEAIRAHVARKAEGR